MIKERLLFAVICSLSVVLLQAQSDYSSSKSIHTFSGKTSTSQIIADHTVVEQYDNIPQQYIDSVKKMMVATPGESHSRAYRTGMELLEAIDPKYAVNIGLGEAPTDSYVRVDNYLYWFGEDGWYTWHAYPAGERPEASNYLKNLILEYNLHGHPYNVLEFGWCGNDLNFGEAVPSQIDPVYNVRWYGRSAGGPDGDLSWGLDADDNTLTGNKVNLTTYFGAMEEYQAYCAANSPNTKMVFTTGPVDWFGWYTNEYGYQGFLKYEAIRNYVKADQNRILFDYADILCYNDDGSLSTQTWNGHTFPSITETNYLPTIDDYHISQAGAIRIAKAQWWMLARIAGWDGGITAITAIPEKDKKPEFKIVQLPDKIIIESENLSHDFSSYSLYSVNGALIHQKKTGNNSIELEKSSLASGIYIVVFTGIQQFFSLKIAIP